MLTLSELQELACSLSVEERTRLVRAILDSMAHESRNSLHPGWMQEIDERLAAFERGEMMAIPADHVLEEAYKKAV